MAGAACCVCVGGVNYTISCACNPCGGNGQSLSTSNPNPSVGQSPGGGNAGCGGASCLSNILNNAGKWGTTLIGTLQGKPVVTNKSGVAVGAKGSTSIAGGSSTGLLIILVVVGLLIWTAMRK